jgi:hypothetical protein
MLTERAPFPLPSITMTYLATASHLVQTIHLVLYTATGLSLAH